MIEKDDQDKLDLIAQAILDKKGVNIIALDVRSCSSLTEYFIIAEGTSDRHVAALAKAVIEQLEPCLVEGLRDGEWVVLDFGYIVVHLFHPDLREKYALENLWHEGNVVDLNLQTGK